MAVSMQRDDPLAHDVQELINAHVAFARHHTPRCHPYVLSADSLVAHDIEDSSCRDEGELRAIGTLRRLAATTPRSNQCTPNKRYAVEG